MAALYARGKQQIRQGVDREVAIKVLPAALAQDGERLVHS